MRYRKQSADGDMVFGNGLLDFYIDSPEAVGQAVQTRLRLWKGEWYLNTEEGCDYPGYILGKNGLQKAEQEIRRVIIETEGVIEIVSYANEFDADTRTLSVQVELNTLYGTTTVNEVL